MNRKIIAWGIIAFLLALGAGTLLGLGWSRAGLHRDRHSWLADELHLSPQQQEQMKTIWSQGMPRADFSDRRRAMQTERDAAIALLIPAEQKAAYEKIIADYNAQKEALDRQRSKAFQEMIDRTKQILTDTQRTKYEEMLKRDEHRHGPPGGAPGGPPSPASQPASGPAKE